MSASKKHVKCVRCDQLFSKDNVYSELGWAETHISGLCELCFDDITVALDEFDEAEPEDHVKH